MSDKIKDKLKNKPAITEEKKKLKYAELEMPAPRKVKLRKKKKSEDELASTEIGNPEEEGTTKKDQLV